MTTVSLMFRKTASRWTHESNRQDFGQLLCSLLFWGVNEIPIDVFAYVMNVENFDFLSDQQTVPPVRSALEQVPASSGRNALR